MYCFWSWNLTKHDSGFRFRHLQVRNQQHFCKTSLIELNVLLMTKTLNHFFRRVVRHCSASQWVYSKGEFAFECSWGVSDAFILITSALRSIPKWITCITEKCYGNCTVSVRLIAVRCDFTKSLRGFSVFWQPSGTVLSGVFSTEHKLPSCACYWGSCCNNCLWKTAWQHF